MNSARSWVIPRPERFSLLCTATSPPCRSRGPISQTRGTPFATRSEARCGRVQDKKRAFHLRYLCRYAGLVRGMVGPNKRCARHLAPKASHRDPCDDQFVSSPPCGREERRIEPGECALGLVETSYQKKTPNLEVPRVRRVQTVAVSFERRPRRVQYFRRRAQVARHERDLGLGYDTARTGDRLPRTEGACRTSQKGLRAHEITELRHRDTAKRKRRRVVPEGDALQRAEEVTRGERPRRSRDQRVHQNPVTLVTPAASNLDTKCFA
jgi:hypothetical protein